ncbi:DNA methylase [Shigella sonnei]|nr:DNA methylase [Shigella sonnei]
MLFKNLHREFIFSLDGAATEHDTLLPRFTDDISRQSWAVMKSVFFIVQLNTFHQQGITGLLLGHRFQVQSLFLKKNHVSMKLHRWFAVLIHCYR